MYAESDLDEYLEEIRQHVCSRCIERPPGGPPLRRRASGAELS